MDPIIFNDLCEPYEGQNEPYIFISYSHEDTDIVYQDLKFLSDSGARLWYDRGMHAGQDWQTHALNKIMAPNCRAVIFYLSPNSLRSKAVLRELAYVRQRIADGDRDFRYMSVNIGGKNAYQILRSMDVEEEDFLQVLEAFPHKKIFLPREQDPLATAHFSDLIRAFEEHDCIEESRRQMLKNRMFTVDVYGDGLQILRYNGSGAIVNIPSTIENKKVLSIGLNAFRGNTHITTVIISEGVMVIDDFAFAGCENLATILLPNSLTQIGYEAFRDCHALTQITIPYNVTSIGDYAFYKCHALADVRILTTVPMDIRFAAFSECYAITTLELPETLRELGPYTFNNCVGLQEITIPPSVTELGLSAFNSCVSLHTVYLPSRQLLVNNRSFSRCRNLQRICVPAALKSRYQQHGSWQDLVSLLHYKLDTPQNVRYQNGTLFWEPVPRAHFYTVFMDETPYETAQNVFPLPLPETGRSVSIRVRAETRSPIGISSDLSQELRLDVETEKWSFEDTPEGKVLLRYNGSEKSVTVPEGVVEIADEAFYNNQELEEVFFPHSLRRVGDRSFYHCVHLQNIHFSNAVESMGENAFWGIRIRALTLPASVRWLGPWCFACCNQLETITIESPLTEMGINVFYRCVSLKKVVLPEGYPVLYRRMFRGCTELEDIKLPEGLREIREGSISYVMKLDSITIPKTVETVEVNAFSNSLGLMQIQVDPESPYLYDDQGVLIHRRSRQILRYPPDKLLKVYTAPAGVTAIGPYSFDDTEYLDRLILPPDVRVIGASAFERCLLLREVEVLGDLDKIQKNAFKDCLNMRRLLLHGSVIPEIHEDTFSHLSDEFRVFVPERYLRNYQRDVQWQTYRDILCPMEEA